MTFYFPLPEKQSKSKITYDCDRCKLLERYHTMPDTYIGKKYDGLVIIAQSPKDYDCISKTPLSNDRSILVRSTLFKNGINVATDAAITYAVQCAKRKPTDINFKCCKSKLVDTLSTLKPPPKLIICLGDQAFKSIMDLKLNTIISKIRNRIIPNHIYNCLVFPVFNPDDIYLSYQKHGLKQDLIRIASKWRKTYHFRNWIKQVLKERRILENITINEIKTTDELIKAFELIKQLKEVSFDVESTNTKPYDEHFELTHISFSTLSTAWVFHESLWLDHPSRKKLIDKYMIEILTNKNQLKIIQNAKFEDLVCRYIFKIKQIENTYCTMLATHVIDERRGCTSLDFQNLVRFGIPPYNDTIKSYLVKEHKDDKINRIRQAPHDDMILYAGLDVITTFHNYRVLTRELIPNSYEQANKNYEFLAKGHWVFANMSQRGIPISRTILNDFVNTIDNNIENITKEIVEIPKVKEYNDYMFEKSYGQKKSDNLLKQLIANSKPKRIKLKTFKRKIQIY